MNVPDRMDEPTYSLTPDSARSAFSKILSRAVYNEPEMRNFLKAAALEQFDNDYDVFYPFVKHQTVVEGKTFRQVLLDYAEDRHILDEIEGTLPLLNIYVPDLRAFHPFSAEDWDTSDREIVVAALNASADIAFYGDGERMFSIGPDEIPGFPCLLVKNNERVKPKQSIKVKSVTLDKDSYEFVHAAYDKRLNTKATPATSYTNRQAIVDAWWEFGLDKKYWHRDYIYYGMTKYNPRESAADPHVREYLEMIKFDPSLLDKIADHHEDPKLKPEHKVKDNAEHPLTHAQASWNLWTDGRFEFEIHVIKGNRTGGAQVVNPVTLPLVHPTDIFVFKKISHKRTIKWFNRNRHTYSVKREDIDSKWYFPYNGEGLLLTKWDISKESMDITLRVYERDPEEEITKVEHIKHTYANSANFKFDVGVPLSETIKLNLGFGASTSKTTESYTTTTTKVTKGSDYLGSATLYFSDPILIGNSSMRKIGDSPWFFPNTYMLRAGSVTMQVLPKKIY